MVKWLIWLAVLLVILPMGLCLCPAAEPVAAALSLSQPALYPVEQWMLEAVNKERAKKHLLPATISPALLRDAREHCIEMCRTQKVEHTEKHVAEIYCAGQPDAAEAMKFFMKTEAFKDNILAPRHTKLGATAWVSSHGTIYYVVQFRNGEEAEAVPAPKPVHPVKPPTGLIQPHTMNTCPGGHCPYQLPMHYTGR
jgi:hypothetical protein